MHPQKLTPFLENIFPGDILLASCLLYLLSPFVTGLLCVGHGQAHGQAQTGQIITDTAPPNLPQMTLLSYSIRPHAGSGVVRIDPLRFLAGCRTLSPF